MPVGPRPIAPNVAEVTMTFKQDGQILINKHHFFDGEGYDEGKLNNLGTGVRDWWDTNMKGIVNANVTLTAITCRDLSSLSGLETAVTTGLPIIGTGPGYPSPNHVTVAVSKKTGRSGRSFSGRTYQVGLSQQQVIANTLTPDYVIQLRNGYDALKSPLGPVGPALLCVLSEVDNGQWRPAGICTTVTGIAVDNTVDSQRRRLPGRGR